MKTGRLLETLILLINRKCMQAMSPAPKNQRNSRI